MADKFIKKLNGYVIKDARVDDLLSENSTERVKRTETVFINNHDDDSGHLYTLVGIESATGKDYKIYTTGNLEYDSEYGVLQAAYFSENGVLLEEKYATIDALAGVKTAHVFDTASNLTNGLKAEPTGNFWSVGDQFLIVEAGTPDYWVVGNKDAKYTGSASGVQHVGEYWIAPIETEKVDLKGYATETFVTDKLANYATTASTKLKADYTNEELTLYVVNKGEANATA